MSWSRCAPRSMSRRPASSDSLELMERRANRPVAVRPAAVAFKARPWVISRTSDRLPQGWQPWSGPSRTEFATVRHEISDKRWLSHGEGCFDDLSGGQGSWPPTLQKC